MKAASILRRLTSGLLAAVLLAGGVLPPTPVYADEAPLPAVTAEPEPTPTASIEPPAATQEPEATPFSTPEPSLVENSEPSPTPDASPAPTAEPAPSPTPFAPVDIAECTPIDRNGAVGDTVTLRLRLDREIEAEYQWQSFTEPAGTTAQTALYPYAEGESGSYCFPLEGIRESAHLAAVPDAAWSGMELYLAVCSALADAGLDHSDVSIENGTPNLALQGFGFTASTGADGRPTLTAHREGSVYAGTLNEEDRWVFAQAEADAPCWRDIPGACSPDYTLTLTPQDARTRYRCVVTVTDAAYLAEALAVLAAAGMAPDETAQAQPQQLIGPELRLLPEEAVPAEPITEEPAAPFALTRTTAPALSADGQWVEGLGADWEYLTADTYNKVLKWLADGHITEEQADRYWTKLGGSGAKQFEANLLDGDGFPTGGTRTYRGFVLTDGRLEVNSDWYGRTVYFRPQGAEGTGTAVEIPAYTSGDGAAGRTYKKAVSVLNPYVSDAGAVYLNLLSSLDRTFTYADDTHIRIYSVNCETFNRDPEQFLTDAEGTYRMDAVLWGVNIGLEPDLSGKAYWAMKSYLAEGYGLLIGHDTLYAYAGAYYDAYGVDFDESSIDPADTDTHYYQVNSWLPNDGHWRMNELMGSNAGNVFSGTADPARTAGGILSTGGSHGPYGKTLLFGNEVLQVQDGSPSADAALADPKYRTPSNYPYAYAAGSLVRSSLTHTNGQAAFKRVWVNYNGQGEAFRDIGCVESEVWFETAGRQGTNNFYLTGDGNFLMNQIGHLPHNTAYLQEVELLVNSILRVSQRKQCEICAADQAGREDVHFVHRVNSANAAEVLSALQAGGTYWYSLSDCYMLTEDLTLPEDHRPIEGFTGHWNSDVYDVTLPASGAALFAPASGSAAGQYAAGGENGWNLGTDRTVGVPTVFKTDASEPIRTTAVARVLGSLNDLFEPGTDYTGYTVRITAADNPGLIPEGTDYTCTVNPDGKYVLSNLPCLYDAAAGTGMLIARVYRPDGTEVTEYGLIHADLPARFWEDCETTPLELLDLTSLPPADEVIWLSQEASFTAAVLTGGGEYPAEQLVWQYKAPGRDWLPLNAAENADGTFTHLIAPTEQNGVLTCSFVSEGGTRLPDQPFQYEILYPGHLDTGDPLTSGTRTTLHIVNAPAALDGYQFRLVFRGSDGKNRYTNVDPETGEETDVAVLTVRTPVVQASMTGRQVLFLPYLDKDGARVTNTLPAERWPAVYGTAYPFDSDSAGVPYNQGDNTAVYTSEVQWQPHLSAKNAPVIRWMFRESTDSTEETTFLTAVYDPTSDRWVHRLTEAGEAWLEQWPGLSVTAETTAPAPGTDGRCSAVTTLHLSGASPAMDSEMLHHWFRVGAACSYGTGDSAYIAGATSPDADLYVEYTIDLLPGEGKAVYDSASGSAEWTFPKLEVFAPGGLSAAVLTFCEEGHSASDQIHIKAGNPYGIKVETAMADYVVLRTSDGDTLPEEDWQNFFRQWVSFTTYDIRDDAVEDISWYITETGDTSGFTKDLLAAKTGWVDDSTLSRTLTGSDRFEYRWGYSGAPYRTVLTYTSSFSVTGGVLRAAVTDTGLANTYARTSNGGQTVSGWVVAGSEASVYRDIDLTPYSRLVLKGRCSVTPASTQSRLSARAQVKVGGLTLYDAGAGGIGSFSAEVDISALTGTQRLAAYARTNPDYAIYKGRDLGAQGYYNTAYSLAGTNDHSPHVSTVELTQAMLYSSTFERTSKSAVRYSEVWAVTGTEEITVTLTPDSEKVYDGTASAARFSVTGTEADFVRENARITYYRQTDEGGWEEVSTSADVDAPSRCVHRGRYRAVVTLAPSVTERFTVQGLDEGSANSLSAEFAITPRPLTLHSLYLEQPTQARNTKAYDGTDTAVIRDILTDNVVPGDGVRPAKDSYRGTYARTEAGETLSDEGTALPGRLLRLEEIPITRDETDPVLLADDPYGDYYIAEERYSGAIYRAMLTAQVKSLRTLYGEGLPETPWAETVYAADTVSDSWLWLEGLQGSDRLALSEAAGFVYDLLPDESTPVGTYALSYAGLTEQNFPVLKNYILSVQAGVLEVQPRKLRITPMDTHRMTGDDWQPIHAVFELQTGEETYTTVGDDRTADYADLPLVGEDTVASVLRLQTAEGTLQPLAADGVPFETECTADSPARFLDPETEENRSACAFCAEWFGFEAGTAHGALAPYEAAAVLAPADGPALTVATVENLHGEQVANYELVADPGRIYVHPWTRVQLEVTVPLTVCMYAHGGDGEVTEPTAYAITNHSLCDVHVTQVKAAGGWQLTDRPTAAGELMLRLQGLILTGGTQDVSGSDRWVIPRAAEDGAGTRLPIETEARIAPAVNQAGEQFAARVEYTVEMHLPGR